MKVLMVNKFLYPNGGSETYIFEIGKQLVRMGHEVQYFGMEHEGRIVGNHSESYTTEMDFHAGKLKRILYPFKIMYSIEARKKIRKILDDFEPDVVHLNNFNFQLTPSIIYEIKTYKKKSNKEVRIIFTAHDYQLVCPNHMMKIPSINENCERCLGGNFKECGHYRCIHNSKIKSILGSMEGYLYKTLRTYRYIDSIICPSYFMEKKMKSNPLFCGKTKVLHNFVSTSGIEKIQKRDYILYFGRYSEEKGIRTLLSVCRKLNNIPFVFAGGGPMEQEIEKTENIRNVGFLSGENLSKLIAEARFSVYPSEWNENCPFSVMESITFGTPVIGSAIGGIPELVCDNVTGVLFQSGNEEDLYNKIKKLWFEKERLQKYTENCRIRRFDTVEEYCHKLLLLYADGGRG